MEIRSFQPEDEPGVIAIWQEVFAYPTQHNNPAFTIGLKLRAQPQLFFVAVEEEKVIGTVMGGYDGHKGLDLPAGGGSGKPAAGCRVGAGPSCGGGVANAGVPED